MGSLACCGKRAWSDRVLLIEIEGFGKRHIRTFDIPSRHRSAYEGEIYNFLLDCCHRVSDCLRGFAIRTVEASSHTRIFEVHVRRRRLLVQPKELLVRLVDFFLSEKALCCR